MPNFIISSDVHDSTDSCDVYLALSYLRVDGVRFNQDVSEDSSYGRKLVTVCMNNDVYVFSSRIAQNFRLRRVTTTFNTLVDYIIGSPLCLRLIKKFKILDFDSLYSYIHCGTHLKLKSYNRCVKVISKCETEHLAPIILENGKQMRKNGMYQVLMCMLSMN